MTRPGDVVTVTGKIVEKKEESGENIVVGNVEAKNQKNEILVAGSFAAALPSKN
jgi:acyl-coenzyme A thioesterase PaaI-like protein